MSEPLHTIKQVAEEEERRDREARAWVLGVLGCPKPEYAYVAPATLQRQFRSLSYNRAASILEAMEQDGDLVRHDGRRDLHFALAPKAANPTRAGVELHLSPKEHGALLRGLDKLLTASDAHAAVVGEENLVGTGDAQSWRAIRARLKRPA